MKDIPCNDLMQPRVAFYLASNRTDEIIKAIAETKDRWTPSTGM